MVLQAAKECAAQPDADDAQFRLRMEAENLREATSCANAETLRRQVRGGVRQACGGICAR